jgi:hypothetical protein
VSNLPILDHIRSQKCNIKSLDGIIIGQASCTVSLPSDTNNILLAPPGKDTTAILGPKVEVKPTIRLFSFSDDEDLILQNLFTLSVIICLSECEYFEVLFQNLTPHPLGKQIFSFNIDEVSTNNISKEEYENSLILKRPIDWSNIRIPIGGTTKDYAFEELCREIILKDNKYSNFAFLSQGPDRGRDGKYELIEVPFPKNMAVRNCILQCKYSNNINTNMNQLEIREELAKVEQHYPDYYILVTNRNTTQDFIDWFTSMQRLYRFKLVLVQRQTIESIIWYNVDIWSKYFG